ncbi:caspase-8 isoform X1 [Schistocerca americana]|uniref:caspase-8 isoform X1 n=2 Tax=Schistocerca americana TaxID=7009 RepID=UPI001F501AE5|nr:caspase-8 isoform X1 [Schistocerca americana]
MLGERGSLVLRFISQAFITLWDFIFFCSSASVSWVLRYLPLRMEIPNCSSESSSTEVASLVKKAIDLAESDHNSSEFLDGSDEDIETDNVEPNDIKLANDHENPVKHVGHQRNTVNPRWQLTGNHITPDQVSDIEKELDFYEKIALVFLLYDNEDLALQRIKVAKQSNRIGLISDWARLESSTNPHWHDKFLEALCIIQNYKLIRKLGFSRSDVDLRFLPDNNETSVYVHIVRKALYILCESLDGSQSVQLLNHLKRKLVESGHAPEDLWAFDPDLLEIALLQMMSLRFLNVGSCTDTDAAGLVYGLKAVGAPELAENFQSLCSRKSEESLSTASEMSFKSSSTSPSKLKNEISAVPSVCDDDFRYYINLKHVGMCLIINQKVFTRDTTPASQHLLPEEPLETRMGTDLDRDRLIEIFTKLGFLVLVRENLTDVTMEAEVKTIANKVLPYHSCFALCILSHGKKNVVYGSNSLPVYVDKIESMLHGSQCKPLFRKPKILIIQACQGTTRQQAVPYEDIVTDGPACVRTAPEVGDMVTFWSTVPGYAAFRDKVHGSWFVKSLWNEMMSEGTQRDLAKIFTRVIGRVSDRHANMDGERKAMMPTFNSTLRRDLIFPRLPKSYAEAAHKVVERIMYYKLIDEFANFYLAKRRRQMFH